MRTTIVLDPALLREAKKHAVETGRTLSDLVSDALRQSLRESPPATRRRFRMPTFGREPSVHHEPIDFATALEGDERIDRG